MGDDCWRIDDLAREAGITVDTIRYYAREGLMPAPTPAGRHRLYGDKHLDRLRRIKELQEQRFSLAAIRAVVETDRPGIDDALHRLGPHLRARRAHRAVRRRRRPRRASCAPSTCSPTPSEYGRAAYDDTDLRLLEAVAELRRHRHARRRCSSSWATIYVRNFQILQRRSSPCSRARPTRTGRPSCAAVQDLSAETGRLVPAVDQCPQLRAPAHAAALHPRRDPRGTRRRRS